MKLRLGTRGSELARTQSGLVADALRANGHEVELVVVRSDGDVTAGSLLDAGGLGVFAASLRRELLVGRVDLAVHSLKDLPTAGVDGLVIAAIPPREDPSDALCARDGLTLATLPAGARVGTGSPRRAAQLRVRRPDLTVVEIRGNVGTRLARVHGAATVPGDGTAHGDATVRGDGTADGERRVPGDLDAVVLATAGLARLGRADAITDVLDLLPAPGQGALAVECRADDAGVRAALAALDDPVTRACVTAERTVLADLAAGCAAPVACRARVIDGRLALTAAVFNHAGTAQVRAEHTIDLPVSLPRDSGDSPIHADGTMPTEVAHAPNTPTRGVAARFAAADLPASGEYLGHVAAADLLARGAGDITPLGAGRPSRLAEFHDEGRAVDDAPTGAPGAVAGPFHDSSELWAPGTVPALVGRRVLLPRADGALADAIRAAGAAVDCIRVTTTRVLPFSLPGPADWLILTSPTAVRVLVDADVDLPMLGAQIAAVGPATAAAVSATGARVDLVCEGRSDAGALLDLLADLEPGSALLPGSALAYPRLADGLTALGWDVEVLPIYTTEPVAPAEATGHAGWSDYDAVVLTAGSIARAAVQIWRDPPPQVAVVAFGEPTAAACTALGIRVAAVATTQDGPGVVAALAHALNQDGRSHPQEDR